MWHEYNLFRNGNYDRITQLLHTQVLTAYLGVPSQETSFEDARHALAKVESRVLPEAFVLLEGHAVTPAISRRWGNSVTGGPQPPKKSPVSLGDGAVNGHVVVGEQGWAQKPPRQRPRRTELERSPAEVQGKDPHHRGKVSRDRADQSMKVSKIKGVAEGRRRRYTPRHVVVW